MPKKTKNSQRRGVCAYCGAAGPITMDHVFAECLFVKNDPVMVTVPACKKCHDEKNKGETDLRDFVAMELGASGHPNQVALLEKTVRATKRNRSKIGAAYLASRRDHALHSRGGIYLGQVVAVPVEGLLDDMYRSLGFVVRGLYFHETDERLPSDCPVTVEHVEPVDVAGVRRRMHALTPTDTGTKGNEAAQWTAWRPADAPGTTAWLLVFNGGVHFVGYTRQASEIVANRSNSSTTAPINS